MCQAFSPYFPIVFDYFLHKKNFAERNQNPDHFRKKLVGLMAESLWKNCQRRSAPHITVWIFAVKDEEGWAGGRCWAPGLCLAQRLKICLVWTERAPTVTTASLWLAFADPGEFMKCAEDVTLVPIHFINELLRKLISCPGSWHCPGTCLLGTKCHDE